MNRYQNENYRQHDEGLLIHQAVLHITSTALRADRTITNRNVIPDSESHGDRYKSLPGQNQMIGLLPHKCCGRAGSMGSTRLR